MKIFIFFKAKFAQNIFHIYWRAITVNNRPENCDCKPDQSFNSVLNEEVYYVVSHSSGVHAALVVIERFFDYDFDFDNGRS